MYKNHSLKFWIFFGGAIILVLISSAIHLTFLRMLPDPFFETDSSGYFVPALNFIFKGKMMMASFRTEGYPLFLIACITVFHTFRSVLIIQHLLLIATAALTGLIYFRFINKSPVQAFLVAWLVSIAPEPLVYSHTVMSENLFGLIFISTVYCYFKSLQDKNVHWVFITAALACLATFIRPVGIATLFAMGIAYACFPKKDLRIKQLGSFGAAVLFILLFWASFNYLIKGFFGLAQRSSLQLFGSTGYLLDVDSSIEPSVRKIIEPVYARPKRSLRDQNFVMFGKEGPVSALKVAGYTDEELNPLLNKLALTAIKRHPVRYAQGLLGDIESYITTVPQRPAYFVLPRECMMWLGFKRYWDATESVPEGRALLSYTFPREFFDWYDINKAKINSQLSEPNLFLSYRASLKDPYLDRIAGESFYPFENDAPLASVLDPIVTKGHWITIGGISLCLILGFFSRTARCAVWPLFIIAFFHLVLSDIGGGVDGRYAVPIQPFYYIFFVFGISETFLQIKSGWNKKIQLPWMIIK